MRTSARWQKNHPSEVFYLWFFKDTFVLLEIWKEDLKILIPARPYVANKLNRNFPASMEAGIFLFGDLRSGRRPAHKHSDRKCF